MPGFVYLHSSVVYELSWLHSVCLSLLENTFERHKLYIVVPWILCCFNKWRFDFFGKCPICKFGNYWWNFIMLRNRRLVFFWLASFSILDSISSGDPWRITLCISFARTLLVVFQDSLSDSCLMFWGFGFWCHLDHLGGSLSDSQGPPFFYLMSQCRKHGMLSFQCFRKQKRVGFSQFDSLDG